MNVRLLFSSGAVLALLLAVWAGSPAPANADAGAATTVTAAALEQPPPPAESPPRTLRAHWHVFAAFATAWILLFGYLIWIAVRLRRAEQSLAVIAAGTGRSSA